MYRILINDTEYRLGEDYEINEQAGATAVMGLSIDVTDKAIPQPFDTVEVKGDQINLTADLDGGMEEQTVCASGAVSLAIDPILDDTWAMFEGMAWEDL